VLVYFNDDFEGGETRFIEPLEQLVTTQDRPRSCVPAQAAPRGVSGALRNEIRHADGCRLRGRRANSPSLRRVGLGNADGRHRHDRRRPAPAD
jgi:hypothetical protein